MAKRKAPQKQCPKCGKMNHARKSQCDCGYKFSIAGSKSKVSNGSSKMEVMTFILKNGGKPDAVKKSLEKLKADSLMEFAIAQGGIKQAIKAIESIEAELAIG